MDVNAELKKQMDELKEHLIVLSMIENKPPRRIQDHERRIQEHEDWLRDHNIAMMESIEWRRNFEAAMADQKDKINLLVALADDWIRRRDDDNGKGSGNGHP